MNIERLQRVLDAAKSLPEGLDAKTRESLVDALSRHIMQEELERRERYLRALVSMQHELLTSRDTELGALNSVLAPLGHASGASRVYLFENHTDEQGRLLMSQRAEWCAVDIIPELHNPELQALPYDEFFPRWSDTLRGGDCIEGLVSTFPKEEREILEPQAILSILVIPMCIGSKFLGFVGFDDCVEERVWNGLEKDLLMSAASNISLSMEQWRAERELVEVNHALEIARDQAQQASHAKSTFLAKVSHELRTPLNAVIGYSELLLEEMESTQEQEDVGRILRSGRHLLLMVDDLLDLSRIELSGVSLQLGEHLIEDLVEDAVTMLQHAVETQNNHFDIAIEPDMGVSFTDRKALTQILLNLLSNAFKYTHQGSVSLRVSRDGDDFYVVTIADTGKGMTPEELARVFDAFVQADDSYTRVHEGVGLGLAISRKLCNALDIELDVESIKGEGTQFKLRVPRVVRELKMPEEAQT